MRLLLIAHGLIDRTGHHYMEARAFKEGAASQGLECTILAHRDISTSLHDELEALPLFQNTPYKRFFRRRFFGLLRDFRLYGRHMSRELMSLPPGMVTSSDVVVSTLTKARDMQALALWLARIPQEQRPFVAINFMIDDITRTGCKTSEWTFDFKSALFYRLAFTRLRKALGVKRLLLTSGGAAFAQAMTRVLGHPVLNFPLPVQHGFSSCQTENACSGESPLIVFLGHMQQRKGSDLIGAVIPKVLEQYPNCRFLLQANPESWEQRWRDELGPIAGERVHIHRGEMSQEEYQSTMNRADLVLLPYVPSGYVLQTSGIFSEAMAMGKVSVIPDGTWMADMAHQQGGGAVMFPKFETEAIAKAVCSALQSLPKLTREMESISSTWRESMGMEAFLRRILDEAMASRLGA
jgi:glycosyltransferase involved in cell wall biosynthesis